MSINHGVIAVMLAVTFAAQAGPRELYVQQPKRPRLLCSPDELRQVRGRLQGEVEAAAWQRLLQKCDAYLDPRSGQYVDWPVRRKSPWRTRSGATWLTKCFEELAWAGALSGDRKYLDGARDIVLTIIRERVIDQIGGTNYGRPYGGWLSQPLDAGHSSRSLAVFYDLLYDHLTAAERAEVRDYIVNRYLTYFHDYMAKAPTNPQYPGILGHNFALIGNSAAALLTLAVWGETGDSVRERAWLDLFVNGIRQYLEIGLGADGDALEGAGYTSACLYYLTFPAEALRRAGGEDLFEHPRLKRVADYYLYEMLPGRNYFNNTNDAFYEAHTCFFPLYARIYGRPEISWLWREVAGRLKGPVELYGDGRNAAQPVLNYVLLWYPLAPPPRSPDELGLPRSRLFARRGLVAMRSNWKEDGCLLSFTCGGNPDFGHGQYDSTHFSLYCGKSALAGDTGYGGGSAEDHNTVLFDGKGQQKKCTEGRIVAYAPGRDATYCAGRAGDLYANAALKRFDRHLWFLHDERRPYAVVYDDIEADGAEHAYTWLLQGVNDHGFMMSGEGIEVDLSRPHPVVIDRATSWRLQVVMFAAAGPVFSQDVRAIRWNPTAAAVPHPRLKADIRTAASPDIITVLLPHREGDPLPGVSRVNARAVKVEWPECVDLVAFGPARTAEAATETRNVIRTPK